MSTRSAYWMVLMIGLAFLSGCKDGKVDWTWWDKDDVETDSETTTEDVEIPEDLRGTIAEVASLVSEGSQAIIGEGVVIGLGKNGSSEIPPNRKKELVKYVVNELKIHRPSLGTGEVSALEFLADPDTALVEVEAVIPPGLPKGSKLDVMVRALPRTQTKSLEGGMLLPMDMYWNRGVETDRVRDLKTLARAEGSLFVNPFLDPESPKALPRLRTGRVLNGAVTTKAMPIVLQLHQPDYHVCATLQRRINERFGRPGQTVANAKDRYTIQINIPPQYAKDYEYFLTLLMHIPRESSGPALEMHSRRVAKAMERDDVNHDGLALIWEAIGRQVLPVVQGVYSSENIEAAYFAARTGVRMGDRQMAGPLLVRFAEKPGPLQLNAIRELGRHPELLIARQPLRALLDSQNELARIAAYEALLQRGDTSFVRRHTMDNGFHVDLVETGRDYVIYATQTGEPKIVLFGPNMRFNAPVFHVEPHEMVTLASKQGLSEETMQQIRKNLDASNLGNISDPAIRAIVIGLRQDLSEYQLQRILRKQDCPEFDALRQDHLLVYRKLDDGGISRKFRVDHTVWNLVKVLGSEPRPNRDTGEVPGLGLDYSQTVGCLYRLTQDESIPAKFVLQPLPELQRIYETSSEETSRPDRPED